MYPIPKNVAVALFMGTLAVLLVHMSASRRARTHAAHGLAPPPAPNLVKAFLLTAGATFLVMLFVRPSSSSPAAAVSATQSFSATPESRRGTMAGGTIDDVLRYIDMSEPMF